MIPATDAAREALHQPSERATAMALTATPETFPTDSYALACWLDRAFADTEAASQPREGDVYDVKCQCVDMLGPDLDCGKCSGSGYYTLRIPQRPPEQVGAVSVNVRRLVIAAREVFDNVGIDFADADELDKALEPFSALVPYENQPDDTAPTLRDAGPGEIPAGMVDGLRNLLTNFQDIAAMHPNDQPHYKGGARQWGGGDLKVIVDTLQDAITALTPKAPPQTPPDAGIGSDGAGERLFRTFMDGDVSRLTVTALPTEWGAMQPAYRQAWNDLADALATQPGDGGHP